MTAQLDATATTTDREVVFGRVINAPRELVWNAWTNPEHLVRWWGPRGFTNTFLEFDVRPGGVWRFVMHSPDGVDYDNLVVFSEVVRPERLVYTHGSTEQGEDGEFQTTVTFDDEGGKTRLTMRALFPSVEALRQAVEEVGALEGGSSTLDCLEEFLATL